MSLSTLSGTVITFGVDSRGGDSSSVSTELSTGPSVRYIRASGGYSATLPGGAFTAVKSDGTIVTWGTTTHGGDSSSITSILAANGGVKEIYANFYSFAIIMNNEDTVITYGHKDYGGGLDFNVKSVKIIFSTANAYAALRYDQSVATWGYGNTNPIVIPSGGLFNVKSIYTTYDAFAAVKADGTVTAWPNDVSAGQPPDDLTDVKFIVGNSAAFVAVKNDKTIVNWGSENHGGLSTIPAGLSNVDNVYNTHGSFAVLMSRTSTSTSEECNSINYDVSTEAAMEAGGWDIDCSDNTLQHIFDYGDSCKPTESYSGFSPGAPIGVISKILQGTGTVTLDIGNCCPAAACGKVKVYVDDTQIVSVSIIIIIIMTSCIFIF